MSHQSWETWAARTLERRSLVEPSEFVLRRAIAVAKHRPRQIVPRWMAFAAMIAIVGAIGAVLFTRSERPELPPRSIESAVRSSEIVVTGPVGMLGEMPTRFSWEGTERATSYKVTLYAVDDTVLFEGTSTTPELDLPAGLATTLHAAVTYAWAVEAVEANGTTVSRSQRTDFEVRP